MDTGKYFLVLAKKFFVARVRGKIGQDGPKNLLIKLFLRAKINSKLHSQNVS